MATKVQRALAARGLAAYETETMATVLALLECSGDQAPAFFDIGAHIGVYALTVSLSASNVGDVVAFEPTPNTFKILRELADNNRARFRSENVALSDNIGEATFHISDKGETSNSLAKGFKPSTRSIVVPTTTLDEFIAKSNVRPSVIKIDVES